ncbi:MAG: hypothetical protein JO112_02140 [Planctomycetes bacterium]|nr:hypothetical protein [Planctomycetota bacterium]
MKESRNPFRLRRSESIDTDTDFLKLFEPGILEVLGDKGIPETVQPIRSAAGGGKTSLLRLFTPSVLHRLHARRGDDTVKELYWRLQALGAVDERGPQLLGVMLLCGRNFAILQDLPIEQALKNRLFFGLLNARILLAVLRNSLTFKGLSYPGDLDRLALTPAQAVDFPGGLELPCSGQALYDWARGVERTICAELDSFGPLQTARLPGYDGLFSLSIIHPEALRINGEQVTERVVLMMDDIHMLTAQQRTSLVERVIEARSRVGIWIAERFEALSTQEMLASGSSEGRDHELPIEVEWYWRRRHEKFEKYVMRAADRRVDASTQTELDAFRSCLEDSLDGTEYESVFERAAGEIAARVRARVGRTGRFQEWIEAQARTVGTPRLRAIAWRALEILIEREIAKPQKGLFDDDMPLGTDDLNEKHDSRVNQAAELFLACEYNLPYYYGPERIARLASLNIEQFLGLAGAAFEEVIAAELIRGGTQILSARRQHALMKKAAQGFLNDIPNKVRHGRNIRAFLESVGRFSAWYTYDYKPTAPNDPGVSGTAIRMTEREILLDRESLSKRPERARFADLLASALAHNYLVADLDYKCKGELWMVLNLNRLLCVHFDLPLGYGLYKERPLDELCRWVEEPFVPPRRQESFV